MAPSIDHEGYSVVPEVKADPVMQKLSETFSNINAAWIDIDSDIQGNAEVKKEVIGKFFDTRNNGHSGRFLMFLLDSHPYIVVFQYVKDEVDNSKGTWEGHIHENVWKKIVSNFPDADLKDGGNCTVGKYDVILSGKAPKLQVGGKDENSLLWRPKVCSRLGWISKVGTALPKKGAIKERFTVITSNGRPD